MIPINHRVPAAAVWFALCPSVVYNACQRQECADCAVSGALWKGEAQQGFSIARWDFWRKRFGVGASSSEATEETKEACTMAIEGMDRASRYQISEVVRVKVKLSNACQYRLHSRSAKWAALPPPHCIRIYSCHSIF